MSWLQLNIKIKADQAETLEDVLLDCGALSITFKDSADQPILEPALGETPLWTDTIITALFLADIDCDAINQQVESSFPHFAAQHQWEIVEDKDWEREWMSHYNPINCGNDLWICPSWCEPPQPKAVNVLLDPGLAFGTGTHPTTLLCLQWLAKPAIRKQFVNKTIIDYGCGSGILAVAALKLGAKNAVAVDIDPQALIATQNNLKRNHLNPESINTFLPPDAPTPKVDMLFANILAGPLVELAATLCGRLSPGGLLCLSGLLTSQADAVITAYSRWCDVVEQNSEGDWLQIALQRRSA